MSTAGLLGNVCLLVASDPGGEILRLDGGVGPTGGAARGGCCSAGLISGPPSQGKATRMEYKYRIESWIFLEWVIGCIVKKGDCLTNAKVLWWMLITASQK